MWITNAKRAVGGCFLLVALAGFASGACSDKKEDKTQEAEPAAGAEPEAKPSTEPEAKPTAAEPTAEAKPEPPDLASIDVSFLVNPCVESGLSKEACECAGEDAKTSIGWELLAKMSKAPPDTDSAIKKYYGVSEMQKIVAWVDTAGIKCGLEEAE